MRFPLLLFPLAALFTDIVALLHCMSVNWHERNPFPPAPPPEDCLAIASHIPKAVQTSGIEDHPHPPSFPFFPRAYFVHGGCTIRVSYSTEPPPPADPFGPAGTMMQIFTGQQRTPSTPLSVASVAKIWRMARWSINDVIAECLENGRQGFEWAFVDVPEVQDMWYLVQVVGHDPAGWTQRTVTKERAALMHIPMNLHQGNYPPLTNNFKMTIWEVP